ncbi:hypothetical protein I5U62_03955 [Stenotrophomonas maltophilia]|nr:hypothetical protein [Stenotrophomonas geniculata]MBH1626081.1 hypothetical protein [Stenotrophomonas maltophilia]
MNSTSRHSGRGQAFAKGIRAHALGGALWGLFGISALLMFIASEEPLIGPLQDTWAETALTLFPVGNQIIFNVAVGVLVSQAMYVLVVWLPGHAKRKRVRKNLQHHYALFKEQCIYQLLFASEGGADSEVVENLADIKKFRDYFNAAGPSGGEKWYDVMNGLEAQHVSAIVVELGILAEELKYTLAAVDVDDEEVYAFLKRLNRAIVVLRDGSENSDIKYLANFLWELFAGWSMVTGYQDRDFVLDRLERI